MKHLKERAEPTRKDFRVFFVTPRGMTAVETFVDLHTYTVHGAESVVRERYDVVNVTAVVEL